MIKKGIFDDSNRWIMEEVSDIIPNNVRRTDMEPFKTLIKMFFFCFVFLKRSINKRKINDMQYVTVREIKWHTV